MVCLRQPYQQLSTELAVEDKQDCPEQLEDNGGGEQRGIVGLQGEGTGIVPKSVWLPAGDGPDSARLPTLETYGNG